MTHPQIVRRRIEGKDCTLHYDYDQIDRRILSHLSPGGRVEWFEHRMQFVFLEPLKALYGGKTAAHRALNSTKENDLPARSESATSGGSRLKKTCASWHVSNEICWRKGIGTFVWS